MALRKYDLQSNSQQKKQKRRKILRIVFVVGLVLLLIIALVVLLGVFVFKFFEDDSDPVLLFKPTPPTNEGTLIWLKMYDRDNIRSWTSNLDLFLTDYYYPSKMSKGQFNIKACSYQNYPGDGKVCDIDMRGFERCSREMLYGYQRSSPCIFLYLNKNYGWTPEYYDDPSNLPADMPKQLKDHIKSINDPSKLKTVWISCQGEYPEDIEFLGPVTYYPKEVQGFSGYYFPYNKTDGYRSPLVAVQFLRPFTSVVINVECRAWAKNIVYNREERKGFVHFVLLIN